MVYESDFYTTRRPYSRPLVSSYSVTDRPIVLPISTILQLRSIPRMPYVAHKRLVTVIHMPYHTVYHGGSLIPIRVHAHVRPSVLAAEINRIRNLTRPSTQSYTEKYLQSRDYIYFDDEAREIRARVDSLLRRVHVFIPRAVASDFAEEIVPERMRSGDYVRRLISGKQNAKKYSLEPVSWYDVPDRGNFGNLACVKYVAGKPQSVRKPYFKVADLRPADIKNDVNLLSYYSKNREAAANASPDEPMTARELRKARALQPDLDESTPRRAVKTEKETEESKRENKRGGQRVKTDNNGKETKGKVVEAPRMKEWESVQGTQPEGDFAAQLNVTGEPESLDEPESVESKSVKELKPVKKAKLAKAVESVEKSETSEKEEPVKQVEAVKEQEPVTDPKTTKEPATAKEPEPVKEAELVAESVKSPDEPGLNATEPASIEETRTVVETAQAVHESQQLDAVPEPAPTSEIQPEFKEESTPEAIDEPRTAEAVSEPTKQETDEKVASDKNVRQDKEEAVKRIEQYLVKAAEEARSDEERKQAAEEERVKLEMDELKAWEALQVAQERVAHLDDIIEQENVEARRKAEEAKIEAERLETETILEQERKIAEARTVALLKEQERMIVEEELEKARELEEKEERLANVTFNDPDEIQDVDRSCDEVITCDITDQEKEERPYDPITDEDTRIEEENVQEEEQFEMAEDPFVEEPEGAESKPETGANTVEGSSKIEDVTSGGEGTFQWGNEDA
ncbi:uncharacterized protein LOC143427804 [Xylocopa sonorina]|uniref:uncharacterized protein LOC143427804 n=1 Tax=Xylocopa sonorina TaxID=1818115 RepID=UPI00403AD800